MDTHSTSRSPASRTYGGLFKDAQSAHRWFVFDPNLFTNSTLPRERSARAAHDSLRSGDQTART